MYELRHVKEHIEVYLNGEFLFSADTVQEAFREMETVQYGRVYEQRKYGMALIAKDPTDEKRGRGCC